MSLLFFASIFPNNASANDTIRVAQYNLLNYGVGGTGCDNPNDKNVYLGVILPEFMPDILCVNEIGGNSQLHSDNIVVNVLKPLRSTYEHATFVNNSGSNIANMLFYDSAKFGITKEAVINHNLRDINYYELFYKDPGLASGGDTAWLNVVIVHMKAASSPADKITQESQATAIMNYLDGLAKPGNYLLFGDLNMSGSTCQAYAKLTQHTNADTKFNDPLGVTGNWDNCNLEYLHTQSTRTSGGCGSGGGLDDRFDQILLSDYVMNNTAKVKFIPGTYTAFGNDANHCNQAINSQSPPNSAVSAQVAGALHDLSDHLPVYLDLEITTTNVSVEPEPAPFEVKILGNPFGENLSFTLSNDQSLNGPITCELLDIYGKTVVQTAFQAPHAGVARNISTAALPAGLYFLKIGDKSGKNVVKKLIKR